MKSIFSCPWTCLLAFSEYDCHCLPKEYMQYMLPKQKIFRSIELYKQDVASIKTACSFSSTDCKHDFGVCQFKLYRCLGLRYSLLLSVLAHIKGKRTHECVWTLYPSICLINRFRVTCFACMFFFSPGSTAFSVITILFQSLLHYCYCMYSLLIL